MTSTEKGPFISLLSLRRPHGEPTTPRPSPPNPHRLLHCPSLPSHCNFPLLQQLSPAAQHNLGAKPGALLCFAPSYSTARPPARSLLCSSRRDQFVQPEPLARNRLDGPLINWSLCLSHPDWLALPRSKPRPKLPFSSGPSSHGSPPLLASICPILSFSRLSCSSCCNSSGSMHA